MRDIAARDIDMRDLDLIVDMRPTGPAPVPLDPYADESDSRWKTVALFAASVVLGALVLAGRMIARRPLATLIAIAFVWGAGMVGTNLLRQEKPHPSPLFARSEAAPETTASIPQRSPDPIARIVAPSPSATTSNAAEATAAAQVAAPPARERIEIIRGVQQELARHGLYDGVVDGVAGPRTERAIRTFETRARLQPTGQPSDELLRRLRAAPVTATRSQAAQPASVTPQATPQQRSSARTERSEQETTRLVQRRLADMGYAPGPIDGQVTPLFRRAVERFQRDNDLSPTGAVDRAFLDRLAAVTGPLS